MRYELQTSGASPGQCAQQVSAHYPPSPIRQVSWWLRDPIQFPWLWSPELLQVEPSRLHLPRGRGAARFRHPSPHQHLRFPRCVGALCQAQGTRRDFRPGCHPDRHRSVELSLGVGAGRGPSGPRPELLELRQQLLIRHRGRAPFRAWTLQRKICQHLLCTCCVW